MAQRLANDHLFPGPRLLKQQPLELSNALGADQIILPTSNVVSDTNLAVTTIQDIYPGDTTIFMVGTRSGTPTGITSITGLPAGCSTEFLRWDSRPGRIAKAMPSIVFRRLRMAWNVRCGSA